VVNVRIDEMISPQSLLIYGIVIGERIRI